MGFKILFAVIFVASNASLVFPANSDSRNVTAGTVCSPATYTSPGDLEQLLESALASVSEQVSQNRWGSTNVTSSVPEIDMFGQCYGNLRLMECGACFARAKNAIMDCLPAVSAAVYLDGCFLRYAGAGGWVPHRITCGQVRSPGGSQEDKVMKENFAIKVRTAIDWMASMAANGSGFSIMLDRGGVEDVYVLGQCWNTMGAKRCRHCLDSAGDKLRDRCAEFSAIEGRAMLEDCYVRYSTKKFFELNPSANDSTKGWIIVAGVLSSIVLALLLVFGIYFCCRKIPRMRNGHFAVSSAGETPINLQNYRLHFKYETLERATDYFHSSRKLGQGGSGSVFKGTLPDGRTVAVKRLFFSTRQWVDEFFNEVNLINGIEHKNLVKLLGCSIEGPESLLVYEFVPNRSLDQIIFDKKSTISGLTWQQRFDIILGVAKGLAYLHGGCGVRIIHRDIKASNILLGDNLVPKIADFGLARSVAQDKTHLSTGIAGTLGYMAPEYLVRGQLTEKADLYAFGVLVLEIVCGRRNSTFTLGSSSILHNVWKLHKENNILESVDPSLLGDFDAREASDVLRIGLLCTQASVALRPSMSEVIQMLCEKGWDIPSPKQPPFLNASLITTEDNISISSSSLQIPSEISCSFTANSSTIYESVCHSGVASKA